MIDTNFKPVIVIGAGLAGVEASYFLASRGIKVKLFESKTIERTPAQKTNHFAELVCTNSLKSMNENSAHGLLKTEMAHFNSLVLKCAYQTKVPAGDALAVDREEFGKLVTKEIYNHPLIEVIDQIVDNPEKLKEKYDASFVLIATGPLTLGPLEDWLIKNMSEDDLYFYDAIAPVVDSDSLDLSKMYFKDRHKDENLSSDYLNIPLGQEQYYRFVQDVCEAEIVPVQNFEKEVFFESCLPIDVMAKRGKDTLSFSCMKPVGLEYNGKRPFAVVQLRKENLLGSAYNMVGFQNRLTYKEQLRIFKTLPGMENASFNHLGSVHRNTFINARKLLNFDLASKKYPWLYFAGQITGVEGYTESSAMGIYTGFQILKNLTTGAPLQWPVETMIGSLINYLMTAPKAVPRNANFGLLPTVELNREQRKNKDRKKVKKELVCTRAREVFTDFMEIH
jgi:methylenetetrahydrofolate--tRNA-(uracil-5-)-methyltransferase